MGAQIYQSLIYQDRWKWYVEGIGKTVLISIGAIAIGVIIGVIVALIKYVSKKYGNLKILSKICDFYLTVFRGTPVYVQLLIMYLIVLVMAPDIWVAIITFGINSGAYVAEIFRGGLEAVDDGQLEAGSSLGLSKFQVMIHVVLPQGIRHALPSLFNEFIALIKETSIVGTIGVIDITKVASRIVARTYEPFIPYIVSAVIYLVIVVVLTQLLKLLERRLAKSDRK
jgi:His/Glu/Gln/Arg/opine family amino acid ABC transporter permease subunit